MQPHDDDQGDDSAPTFPSPLTLALTAAWALVTFVPPLFAHELRFEVFGLPFALWVAAQGAPIVYLLLVWVCERRADRPQRMHATDPDGH